MQNEVRAAGLVVYRLLDTRVEYLLLQAIGKENHWTPPKGRLNPGESDREAALRETEEESGLKEDDLQIADFQKEIKYDVSGRCKTTVFWLAQLTNGSASVKLSDEHRAFQWLPLADACQLVDYPAIVELLRACDDFLSKH